MRFFTSLCVLLSVSLLTAQDVGDVVVVTVEKSAELTDDDGEAVTTVPTCAHLVVVRANDEAYWVRNQANYLAGWIRKDQVVPVERAVEFFSQQIREDLTSRSHRYRGIAYMERGEYEKAIEDFTEAIRLDPNRPDAWNFRAGCYRHLGRYDEAIADCDEAIRLAPRWVAPYTSRGVVWQNKGEYGKAIADYQKVIELDPNSVRGHNNLAWIRATCPDGKFRDGEKAVESGIKACELSNWKAHYALNTLGAAYAEKGDFQKAIEYEQKARELYPEDEKKRWEFLIEQYRSGQPYRQDDPE
jgi:tetratricopeptide (TPR) repeat protein